VFLAALLAALVALAGCSAAPLGDLALTPSTPQRLAAGATLDFDATPAPGGLAWSVGGVAGGTAATGTIGEDGTYAAPARLLDGPIATTVTATDATDATRSASVDVSVYAPGTLYALEFGDVVAVFEGVDEADGATPPSRTFALDGGGFIYGGMALAAAADTAFIATLGPAVGVVRVPNVSTAEGAITEYVALNLGAYGGPSDLAYDDVRDVLYVRASGALLAFDDATTSGALQPPARVVTSPFLDLPNVRLALDVEADRLFLSWTNGVVAVYDDVSTVDGAVAQDRTIAVDTPTVTFTWGLAYDAGRDELYVADQRYGAAVYVIASASTADGAVAPSRTLGGAANPISRPSEVFYDAHADRLVLLLTGSGSGYVSGFAVFEEASTRDGDVPADRLVTDATVPIEYPAAGYFDSTR
jgi:hypothetical protein